LWAILINAIIVTFWALLEAALQVLTAFRANHGIWLNSILTIAIAKWASQFLADNIRSWLWRNTLRQIPITFWAICQIWITQSGTIAITLRTINYLLWLIHKLLIFKIMGTLGTRNILLSFISITITSTLRTTQLTHRNGIIDGIINLLNHYPIGNLVMSHSCAPVVHAPTDRLRVRVSGMRWGLKRLIVCSSGLWIYYYILHHIVVDCWP